MTLARLSGDSPLAKIEATAVYYSDAGKPKWESRYKSVMQSAGLPGVESNWRIMAWSKAGSILVLLAGSVGAQSISLPDALNGALFDAYRRVLSLIRPLPECNPKLEHFRIRLSTIGGLLHECGRRRADPRDPGVGGVSTFTGTFGGTTNNWNQGAIGLTISGVGTVQIFPANAANGAGSGAPPNALSLPSKSLSSLGFGPFSAVNPTITFFLLDNVYPDNSGSFTLTQGIAATPVPSTLILSLTGLAALAIFVFARRRAQVRSA